MGGTGCGALSVRVAVGCVCNRVAQLVNDPLHFTQTEGLEELQLWGLLEVQGLRKCRSGRGRRVGTA
jgi:hypothetical protein